MNTSNIEKIYIQPLLLVATGHFLQSWMMLAAYLGVLKGMAGVTPTLLTTATAGLGWVMLGKLLTKRYGYGRKAIVCDAMTSLTLAVGLVTSIALW